VWIVAASDSEVLARGCEGEPLLTNLVVAYWSASRQQAL